MMVHRRTTKEPKKIEEVKGHGTEGIVCLGCCKLSQRVPYKNSPFNNDDISK